MSTSTKGLANVVVVGTGQAAFLRVGKPGRMNAPNLTICSAILLRGKQNGLVAGYLMGHRQPRDIAFKENLKRVVENECEGLEWEIVAVQTANNPTINDGENNSLDELSADVEDVMKVSALEVVQKAEPGIKESPCVNQMVVEIDASGKETVQRRHKEFYECVVQ